MAVDLDKLNALVDKFVGALRAAAHSGLMVIGKKQGLYKAPSEGLPELDGAGTTGIDVVRCMWIHSDTKTSGNCVTSWPKRPELFVMRHRVVAAAVLSCVLIAPNRSYPERAPNHDDRVKLELSALGKQGDTIARARGQVLDILQDGNACTAWFQEADPDPAEVFRSLHFELEMRGPSYVYAARDIERRQFLKHPWGARSIEYGGRNSTILLNANGPFFNRASVVMQLDSRRLLPAPDRIRLLTIASYQGNTPEAQITILLHELGHIIGRLSEDDDSWDGRSSRNTADVVRHCKIETRAAAHNSAGNCPRKRLKPLPGSNMGGRTAIPLLPD